MCKNIIVIKYFYSYIVKCGKVANGCLVGRYCLFYFSWSLVLHNRHRVLYTKGGKLKSGASFKKPKRKPSKQNKLVKGVGTIVGKIVGAGNKKFN